MTRHVAVLLRYTLIVGHLLILMGCVQGPSGERVLFDFESDAELDRFHWRCHTLFSLADKQATHGEKSLRLELYPSDYPGLAPKLRENDWRGYKGFRFDVYNPNKEEVRITVRIDDRRDYPNYADRYNKSFILKPGMNRMKIPLDTLVTSGTDRKLNLKEIYRVLIFMTRPERRVVLYVDYLRLVS